MNFNLYLPDDLGQRARDEKLKLSPMLRDAVIAEFEKRDAMTTTLNEQTIHEVDLKIEGQPVTGRIHGTLIASTDDDINVYLTEDRRVLLVAGGEYYHFQDPETDLYDFFIATSYPGEGYVAAYVNACRALGIRAVIDL